MLTHFTRKMRKFKTFQQGNLYVARAYYETGVQVEISQDNYSKTRFFPRTVFNELIIALWINKEVFNIKK